MTRTLLLLPLVAVTLAACSANPSGMPRDRLNRILDRAPFKAQPSLIVATEAAMARAAREDGQWTALGEFAADGATIHGRNGGIPARQLFAMLDEPEQAPDWQPKAVWMSCASRAV